MVYKDNDQLKDLLIDIKKQNDEILFANIFRDSTESSKWLKDRSFSPYRSAANYSLLYKLYKIYDIFKPENILEFGLGQTTKLTTQYLLNNPKARGLVVDDDQEWIDVFEPLTKKINNIKIIKLPIRDFIYKDINQKKSEYDDLEKQIKNDRFNLIIVDGPIGYDKEYSRTNIVRLVSNLAEDWVVIFDDAERDGEKNTIKLFTDELSEAKKDYAEFEVSGIKTQHYFCSKNKYELLVSI